ncbi:MAG: cation transporter [Verrucomicrobia bacterium]|nr:cation transporter [Verrucomicrobiota bacterium]
MRVGWLALAANVALAVLKITVGVLGRAYVLVADGIESTADIFSTIIVMGSLRYSAKPADDDHPFGHGKAESIASVLVSVVLLGAAVLIAVQSVREIMAPAPLGPAWFTLPVLLAVIVTKEFLYRKVWHTSGEIGSTALQSDAWHHRSDALTSAAAFVGIVIALVGGAGYETADDWAALAACAVIVWNGLRMLGTGINEVMDASPPPEVVARVKTIARQVQDVLDVEKCRVRKSGTYLTLDIHVVVKGDLSVRRGHEIAHLVKDHLVESPLRIRDVTVHVEPDSLG